MSRSGTGACKPNPRSWSIRYDDMARGASVHRSDADGELVARARAGDADAYEQLIRRHSDGAYRIVWAVLHDPELAEDALQECFVETYASLHRFDGRRAFAPWIKGIAVRCALVASRKQRRADNVPSQPAASVEDPAATVARSDLQMAVREAIMALPKRQRVAAVAACKQPGSALMRTCPRNTACRYPTSLPGYTLPTPGGPNVEGTPLCPVSSCGRTLPAVGPCWHRHCISCRNRLRGCLEFSEGSGLLSHSRFPPEPLEPRGPGGHSASAGAERAEVRTHTGKMAQSVALRTVYIRFTR